MPYLDIKMEEHNFFTKNFNGNFEKYEYCSELSEISNKKHCNNMLC